MKIKNTKETHLIEIEYHDIDYDILHNHLIVVLNKTKKIFVMMFNVTPTHGTTIFMNPLRLMP